MLISSDNKQSVDQLTVAKIVASRLGMNVSTVVDIIEMEQKTTMNYIKRGYKVIKKNYITIEPKAQKGYKFKSGIDGKEHIIPSRTGIKVRIGEGFKSYVNENQVMKNRLCRFVKTKENST